MRPGRIVVLVLGCILALPALGLLLGGGALGIAALVERDDDGYFDATIRDMTTDTVAVTAEDLDFISQPGEPDWILDSLDVDVRLRVTGTSAGDDVFVGIAREADLDQYLAGVAHAEIIEMEGIDPVYRNRSGTNEIDPPGEQDFWVVSESGTGTQQLFWEAQSGRWAAVVMNSDGSPGVDVDVNVGARSDIVVALSIALLAVGAVLTAGAVAMIIAGASGARSPKPPAAAPPPPPQGPPPHAPQESQAFLGATPQSAPDAHPVTLTAQLDPELSRAKWLIKWFLAIPHFIVLVFLWIAFCVLTVVAAIAILFTGQYPRGIFDFNVGVLRWSWRVQFYATNGGIGSDRYPPFSLDPAADDLATIDVAYPEQLSRPLVLVKWLLAIPHLILVAVLAGSTVRWLDFGDNFSFDLAGGGGLLGLLTLVAGVVLLFTTEYPKALFDLIVGLNRWVFRVIAYVALMTDDYPPFRLDQGGQEPVSFPPDTPPEPPIDLRAPADERQLSVF